MQVEEHDGEDGEGAEGVEAGEAGGARGGQAGGVQVGEGVDSIAGRVGGGDLCIQVVTVLRG